MATLRAGLGTPSALSECSCHLREHQVAIRDQGLVDSDVAIAGLCDVVEAADIGGELLGIFGVLPPVVLQHDAVLRPHQVSIGDPGAIPVEQGCIHLWLGETGAHDEEAKRRFAGGVGSGTQLG